MSLKLPPADSPLREKFDLYHLVEAGRNSRSLPTFREALARGREYLARSPGVSGVNYLALRADGSISLVEIKAGSFKHLFNFGDPLK